MQLRTSTTIVLFGLMALMASLFSGCKPDEETKTKIADLENKITEDGKKISALDSDLKKTNFELSQIKDVVTKIGNVAVDLQKAEELRQKNATKSPVKSKTSGKAAASKVAPKKHH